MTQQKGNYGRFSIGFIAIAANNQPGSGMSSRLSFARWNHGRRHPAIQGLK